MLKTCEQPVRGGDRKERTARAGSDIACVAWRFCRAGHTSGKAAKFAREASESERRSGEAKRF